jgi:hypothetical protein
VIDKSSTDIDQILIHPTRCIRVRASSFGTGNSSFDFRPRLRLRSDFVRKNSMIHSRFIAPR